MFDPKIFDEMTKKFNDALPPALKNMQTELEKNFRASLTSTFQKMDLVTREEFDVQAKVLERTRAKLEALEKQFTQLIKTQTDTTKKTTTPKATAQKPSPKKA
ncbi:accessory factor UbiK family protein [Francisellaceae bacterium]|nr:accessory factor UbiK family protein [Francisellaceae bacterium]